MDLSPVFIALAAAALFGLSTPLAKRLIGSVDPWVLAGLFYLASGLGLAAVRVVIARTLAVNEAPVTRADLPWLAGAIVFGGAIGPILLLIGLSQTEAALASLLLTTEGVATALIAWFIFKENFDRRIAVGMLLIVAGAVVLSWQGAVSLNSVVGPIAIIGACIAWGLDNNLTRRVSLSDPLQIAMLKGLCAGSVNLALALISGARIPAANATLAAGLVGFLGYGVSLVLFVIALRHLGTARTGAYFSTGPFIGATAALPLLGEPVTAELVIAGALMGIVRPTPNVCSRGDPARGRKA
jgi:drug/metabolite transporter (DMT)-like permease